MQIPNASSEKDFINPKNTLLILGLPFMMTHHRIGGVGMVGLCRTNHTLSSSVFALNFEEKTKVKSYTQSIFRGVFGLNLCDSIPNRPTFLVVGLFTSNGVCRKQKDTQQQFLQPANAEYLRKTRRRIFQSRRVKLMQKVKGENNFSSRAK